MKIDMQEKLRQELAAKAGGSTLRLPKEITFDRVDNAHIVHMSSAAVTTNIQKGPAAFEAWFLVMKALLGDSVCETIELSWDAPDDLSDKNYQTFLYRLIRFQQQMGWLSIAPICKSQLVASRVLKPDGSPVVDDTLFITHPPSRDTSHGGTPDSIAAQEEAYLGLLFSEEPSELLRALSWKTAMQRQLPVAVFAGAASKPHQVFAENKSAVDLWASDADKGVVLFELKTSENCRIGAISELFFLTCLVRDVADGVFRLKGDTKVEKAIHGAKQVNGFLVSSRIHPLLNNEGVFTALNHAFAPRRMRFGYMEYNDDLRVRRIMTGQ